MKLPKEITPNPLLTSTVEIRFDSTVTDDAVLSTYLPIFLKSFPKINDKGIPRDIKKSNKLLEYTPDYTLSNDEYSISIAKNSFAFENVGTYHFWSKYFPFIKENLNVLNAMGIVKTIKRVGVRYASLFEGESRPSRILRNAFGIEYNGYSEEFSVYQTNLKKDNFNLFLQIVPKANSQGNDPVKSGFYIDIDASCESLEDLSIGVELFDIIDQLHAEEKLLFFSLLSDEFIGSLNPKY